MNVPMNISSSRKADSSCPRCQIPSHCDYPGSLLLFSSPWHFSLSENRLPLHQGLDGSHQILFWEALVHGGLRLLGGEQVGGEGGGEGGEGGGGGTSHKRCQGQRFSCATGDALSWFLGIISSCLLSVRRWEEGDIEGGGGGATEGRRTR